MRTTLCSFLALTILPGAALAQAASRDTHERLNGVLWVQTSAEYRVLVETTYKAAWAQVETAMADAKAGRLSPSAAVEQPGWNTAGLPLAVIVDIDETVLNNSPMSGKLVAQRTGYDQTTWSKWVALKSADYVAGAQDFITKVRGAGVEVYFVTNRTAAEEDDTIKDLLPEVVTDEQLLASKEQEAGEPAPWPSEKSTRRAYVAKTHWIIAMVGDDLADFIPNIKTLPPDQRVIESQKYNDRYGRQWFLLPNPLYGSWESVLYDPAASDADQLKKKASLVVSY